MNIKYQGHISPFPDLTGIFLLEMKVIKKSDININSFNTSRAVNVKIRMQKFTVNAYFHSLVLKAEEEERPQKAKFTDRTPAYSSI